MIYHGSCHCGDIKVEYETSAALSSWPLRACQCRFCRRHGVVTTSIGGARLRVIAAENAVNEYTFALRVTRFQLCRRCGTYVAAVSNYQGQDYGVLVANVLECRAQLTQEIEPVVYDDEDATTRLARRSERWAMFERVVVS